MSALTYLTTLNLHHCPRCGVAYGLDEAYDARRREDHKTFYCPNGHTASYNGKTEAEKAREEAERLRMRVARLEDDVALEQDRRAHADARANGYKGALTKAQKRAARGVCPASGCKRSFANVAEHVATQHPELHIAVDTTSAAR